MRRMGFADRWVNLIMACVRSVSHAVIVNGNPVGNIKPTIGIRYGDPISPYLFLICVEVLSFILHQAEQFGSITGIPTSKNDPRLSHFFFVDDILLFCKANSVEWRCLMKILEKYEAGSRHKLNLNKTAIIFSRNTNQNQRQKIIQLSGFQATQRYDTYLGPPTVIGKSKKKILPTHKR
jgi:hypothetical protein